MKKNIILIGGGGFSYEIAEVAILNNYNVLGYVDFQETDSDLSYLGLPDAYFARRDKDDYFFPAYGAVDRKGLLRRSESLNDISGLNIPSLVSPNAHVSSNVEIGAGVFLAHGVVVNQKAKIRDFCIVNTNSVIGHDVQLGKYSIVSGNVFIGGGAVIGSNSILGPGANIMQSINIGSNVVVSFGSNVGRDVPDGKTTRPTLAKFI
jgi:sugar O-acyltransferase (sialic acid O-acetyltransferase NeuD family)